MTNLAMQNEHDARVGPPPASMVLGDYSQADEIRRIIGRVGRHLAQPPRVALVGEFNTGKSTLANALIGSTMLPQSVVEHSRLPVLIHYAGRPTLAVEFADGRRERVSWRDLDRIDMRGARLMCLGLPVERLRSFEIIDTPGLATGQSDSDELALDACQRSNIAVWCTAAMQAWKRTELRVWESMPKRLRDNGVLAVTYKDTLSCERDVSKLRARLRCEAAHQFRTLVLVAAADAAQARNPATPALEDGSCAWQSSGGASFAAAVNSAVTTVLAHRLASAERLLSQVALGLAAEPSGASH